MLSLKYRNLIKQELYEISHEKAEQYIQNNKKIKNDLKNKFSHLSNYSFWIIHETSLETVFYFIDNHFIDKEDNNTLLFDAIKLRVTNDKTEIYMQSYENAKTIVIPEPSTDEDKKKSRRDYVLDTISKNFGVAGVNYETANALKDGILSNVKVDRRFIKKYEDKKILSDKEDDDEETLSDKISEKDSLFTNLNYEDEEKRLEDEFKEYKKKHPTENTDKFPALDPSHLIKDNKLRPVNDTRLLAEENVLKYEDKYSKENEYDSASVEEVALAIVYKCLDNVLNAPCNPVNITKYDLKNTSEHFKKDLPDFNLTPEQQRKLDEKKKKENVKEAASYSSYKSNSIGNLILNLISTNPVEVLSPLAFISMNIPESNWSVDSNGISAKKLVNHIFNRDGNNFKGARISYPLERNRMLYDSIILIPYGNQYRRINISTKGGKDGKGIFASLAGIFQYLLKDEYQTEKVSDMKKFGSMIYSEGDTKEDIVNKLKTFKEKYCSKNNLLNAYPEQIDTLILYGCTNSNMHEKICEAFNPDYAKGNNKEPLAALKKFAADVNGNNNFADCVLKILDNQKYDFAQVNAKPYLFGDTFSYDYYVQYPAKFSGTVKLEINPEKGISFHIYGG